MSAATQLHLGARRTPRGWRVDVTATPPAQPGLLDRMARWLLGRPPAPTVSVKASFVEHHHRWWVEVESGLTPTGWLARELHMYVPGHLEEAIARVVEKAKLGKSHLTPDELSVERELAGGAE